MAIIRWNPWNLSSILDEDFDLPTIPGLSRLAQGLNLYETDTEVVAEAALPGIKEDQIDVIIENGIVRITGSNQETQEDKGQRRYFMTSRASSFNYSFRLPEGITGEEEPVCELENGILSLRFKKLEKIPPKKITVRAKKA